MPIELQREQAGWTPSHFTFFLRHTTHARVTLNRFGWSAFVSWDWSLDFFAVDTFLGIIKWSGRKRLIKYKKAKVEDQKVKKKGLFTLAPHSTGFLFGPFICRCIFVIHGLAPCINRNPDWSIQRNSPSVIQSANSKRYFPWGALETSPTLTLYPELRFFFLSLFPQMATFLFVLAARPMNWAFR